MKRVSKIFALLLSVCFISGIIAIFASAEEPSGSYDDLGYAYDHEDLADGATPSYSTNGTGSGSVCATGVKTSLGNKYMNFKYVKDYISSNAYYRRDFMFGIFKSNSNATNMADNITSGKRKALSSYSYLTLDFDLAADQYRYLINVKNESGETVTEERLSDTYPTEEGAYGIRLAYSDKSYFSIDFRPIIKTTTTTTDQTTGAETTTVKYAYPTTSGYVSLTAGIKYDETNGVWKLYKSSSSFTSKNYIATLSNNLGEWNHFTYAIEVNQDSLRDSKAHLFLNGEKINTTNTIYTRVLSSNQEVFDIVPHAIDWSVVNMNSTVAPNSVKYSMAIDNWEPRYYDKCYSSGDATGIDDYFKGIVSSPIFCDDAVYNIDYQSPAPNKYVELDGKKVYIPALAGKLFKNIKNGAVIKTDIDLIGIDPPAWTSFSIKCDTNRTVTLSNEAIARGATITKTADGYRIGSGIMANMSLFTDMRFNLYLPKIEGVNILSVSNASLAEDTYWVNGNEMYVISATPKINSFDAIEATVKYSMGGNEYDLNILLDVLSYASNVSKLYECGSEESKLIYQIISYKEAAAKYLDPEFEDNTGALAAFKAIYSSHTDCGCVSGEVSLPENELNVDYSKLIENGINGIAYQVSLDEIGMAIYVKDGTAVDSVSYKNSRGDTVIHTVENGTLAERDGYYTVKSLSAADINNVMTITVGNSVGTFSLAKYIQNNQTVDIAKSIYAYSVAAKNYKSVIVPYKASHLILNNDGTYGGTLSEELYGKGAPLNGEYDVNDSDYYTVNNDYYTMPSTSERIIFPNFSSYQQTMQDSSGLACLLMILNYMGEDVKGEYSELALLKKYQAVNDTTVYGKGTTADGLEKLVESLGLGYTAESESLTIASGDSESTRQTKMKNFFTNSIKEGKFVLVRYTSPVGYGWKLVLGYDNLGKIQNTQTEKYTDHFGDDVIIFAEPYDGFDHCQDGYATERAKDFIVWWREMELDGTVNETYSYLVIDPNLDIEFDYQPVDETVKQQLYDIHLPLNPDGSYGGTRDSSLYGNITSGKGWWNHTDSNYYKINDFYNMGSEGSRIMLPNYTVLQQTMSSSCGICAVTSVLKYYGMEGDYYDLELEYLNHYEKINADEGKVKGRGTSTIGNTLALAEWGYTTEYGLASKGETPKYTTYEAYVAMISENLLEGRPIVCTTNFGSGHFLTIIGYDDMGTDYIYDDVIITADSSDYWDGYQDGYTLYSAYKYFKQHTNGSYSKLQQHIIIFDNKE